MSPARRRGWRQVRFRARLRPKSAGTEYTDTVGIALFYFRDRSRIIAFDKKFDLVATRILPDVERHKGIPVWGRRRMLPILPEA